MGHRNIRITMEVYSEATKEKKRPVSKDWKEKLSSPKERINSFHFLDITPKSVANTRFFEGRGVKLILHQFLHQLTVTT